MVGKTQSTKDKLFNILVNMNKLIVKQNLETYGLHNDAKNIKITGLQIQETFGQNNASINSKYEINNIQLKKPRNVFRTRLRKNSRVEAEQ